MKTLFGIPIVALQKSEKPREYFAVKNDAAAEFDEIKLYDTIGEDWFGEGDGAKSFSDALDKIPKGRKILVRINSPGGNVWDGIAMYKRLRERAADVTTQIDGIALSIASVIALGGSKVVIAKTGQFMAHDPWAGHYAEGTEEDISESARLTIDSLRAAKKSITVAYMDRSGMSEPDVSAMMKKTSWYVGQEAKDAGFVDEVTNEAAVSNSFDLSSFRRVPEAFRKMNNSAAQGGGQSKHTDLMDKATIIALLKEHGVEVDANATIEQLQSKLKEALAKAKQPENKQPEKKDDANNSATDIAEIKAQLAAEKKTRISAAVEKCVEERRILASQSKAWTDRCLKDESLLTDLQAMQQQLPPEGISVECVSESVGDIANHVRRLSKEIGADISSGSIHAVSKAIDRARAIRKNESKLIGIWNAGTNTIDATLQQDVLLDIGLRAFRRILASFAAFSTKFENVPLRGTDIVTVPFLDLETAASTDFVAATGYVAGDTARDKRQVTINKRKYQGLSFTSQELARQPFLMIKQTMELKAEKLAYDVWLDILSLVKAASFGHATKVDGTALSPKAVAAWDSNGVADLQQVASELQWPIPGRLLFANAALDNVLKKDNALKLALNIGGSEVIREGRVPNIYGFDYNTNANLPDNGESLIGFIAWKTAMLIATAPIPPTEEVIRNGTIYSMAVDPDTGIAMEYRSFGDSQKDKGLHFIECNYGYGKGNASALKRLTSA